MRNPGADSPRAPVLPPSQRVASLPGWAIAINNKFTSATRSLESKLWTKGYDTVLMLRIDCKAYILHLQWLADHRQSPQLSHHLLFCFDLQPRSIADMTTCSVRGPVHHRGRSQVLLPLRVQDRRCGLQLRRNEESPRSVIMMIPDGTGPTSSRLTHRSRSESEDSSSH
ncbi:hypothetical protein GQ600_9738 [Phytophthora cactorum]|nr:hypothetical protein GQ600_9738 [Phytophthora cactorum]